MTPRQPATGRQFTVSRRTALRTGLLGSAAAIAGVPIASARPDSTLTVPDDYATIQAAVDDAAPGDTVVVEGGVYDEQVVVTKDLTLEGRDATIRPPDAPAAYSIPESAGSTWEPLLFAFGGQESGGAVSGADTVDVSVAGFEFDGRDAQPDARRKVGVFYRNASGRVRDNHVHSMGGGGQETMGILAYGDSTVRIENNTVSEFERGGIGANGDGGDHPSPTVYVRDNELDSASAPGEAWGPNGVQIGYGASGQVRDNTVRNCRYSTDTDGDLASGVLVFESDDVAVRKNAIENCDVGVAVSSWGFFRESADNCKLTNNAVRDAIVGVNLRVTTFGVQDASVSNTKVVNNDLDGDSLGDVGVLLNVTERDDGYDATLRNTKVIRNHVTGFETDYVDEGVETKARAFAP